MRNEVEDFIDEEKDKFEPSMVLAIRDMDYVKRKRKVEEMKQDLFGI